VKTALVTGAAGFIGRHITRELESRDWLVTGVDINVTPSSASDVIRCDARTFISELSTGHRYDLVVHCAYLVGGRAAIDGVNVNFLTNVNLDSAIFEWAVRTKQPRVLYWSSSAVYPVNLQTAERDGFLLEEWHQPVTGAREIWRPDARYGWAKYVGELQAETARENSVAVHVVRPFSGYGSDQSLDYPFPSFIKRARERVEPFTIWGSGHQTRDWIHVDDVVRGALAVVAEDVQEPVNLCTGRSTSMIELARAAMVAAHGQTWGITVKDNAPMGVMHRVGDPTLFNQIYTPRVTLEEGIIRAMEESK
jgi:nucleoside-diphosphate-sugar epimerase